MKVLYSKAFSKDINKINHLPGVKRNLKDTLMQLKQASALADINGCKKLQGYASYYRIRIGEYRLGIKVETAHIEIVRFLHRKEVYRRFP
ncbi:MAG: type II toxin-antitoxin system RelE/ParE family toxin [Desulfuromonas sp.]